MKKALLLFGLLFVAYIAHVASQYHLFSIFQIVTSVPLILLLINPAPVALIACTIIFFELFSSLPHGSTLLMFGVPYIVLFFWKKFQVELSWKFFFGVLLIITLQNIALLSIVGMLHISTAFQIPWYILTAQLIATSLGTFILSFIYHEYSARL
ncbi:MAG: hypothetical protein AAB649_07230 [Patescibacteria group bacterium]